MCASVNITGECAFETSCHYGEKGFHLYCLPEVLSFKSVQLDCTLLPDDSVLESAGQVKKTHFALQQKKHGEYFV